MRVHDAGHGHAVTFEPLDGSSKIARIEQWGRGLDEDERPDATAGAFQLVHGMQGDVHRRRLVGRELWRPSEDLGAPCGCCGPDRAVVRAADDDMRPVREPVCGHAGRAHRPADERDPRDLLEVLRGESPAPATCRDQEADRIRHPPTLAATPADTRAIVSAIRPLASPDRKWASRKAARVVGSTGRGAASAARTSSTVRTGRATPAST